MLNGLIADHVDDSSLALFDSASKCWWSYGKLKATVSEIASRFSGPTKSLIFCFCQNDVKSVVAYLAAMEAGNAVVLLDSNMRGEFMQQLISLYRPDLVVGSDTGLSAVLKSVGPGWQACSSPDLDLTWWGQEQGPISSIHDDLCVLLSTSGSTGSPKLARLSLGQVTSNACAIGAALAIDDRERAITSLPMSFAYGLSVLNSHLYAGATIVLTDEGILSDGFWNVFRQQQCTSFAGVPYSYQVVSRLGIDSLDVPSLMTMTQAGGKLDNELISKFGRIMSDRGGRFFVMYGQTEATARISVLPCDHVQDKLGSVGVAIPGGRLSVCVGGHETTQANESGEVVYRGPNVMMGYATGRDELALGDVMGGTLATGDVGYLDKDGFLFITGRTNRVAKLYGSRVNLDEVESWLADIGPAAVVGCDDRLVVFCAFSDEEALARVGRELSVKLKLHHTALELRRVEDLPRTAAGKVDYHRLQELL